MSRTIDIDAFWDDEASVWTAASRDLPGLVAEASTWATLIEEVRLLVPDLLELSGRAHAHEEITVNAGSPILTPVSGRNRTNPAPSS